MKRLLLTALGSLVVLAACDGPASVDPEGPASGATAESAPAEEGPADLDQLIAEERVDDIVALLQPRFDAGELDSRESAILARARRVQGELPKAIRVLKTALEASPASTGLSLELADAYNSIAQHALALKVLEASREAGGSDADLALAFGMTRGLVKDLDGAREEFERARAAGADVDDVDYNVALIELEQGRLDEAAVLLQAVLDRHPDRVHVRRELARTRFRSGAATQDECREAMNAVLEANEKDWRAWELLGDVEMSVPDFLAARTYYTNAIKWSQLEGGASPTRVEEKYVTASEALQAELKAQGVLPEEDPKNGTISQPPPMPQGVLERQREKLRQQRAATQAASGGDGGR